MKNPFPDYWEEHTTWAKNVLFNKKIAFPGGMLFVSNIKGPYYSFARLNKIKLSEKEVRQFEMLCAKHDVQPSIFVDQNQHEQHLTEHLIRHDYYHAGSDTWVALNTDVYFEKKVRTEISIIDLDSFNDFYRVLSVIFKDFEGNETYLKMCKKSIAGMLASPVDDLTSNLYVIREEKKPVAGAGMLFSRSRNIAYLHNAGTLPEHRGQGYQTAMIHKRVQDAKSRGISRVYSIVSQGSTSWANMIRNGFDQINSFHVIAKRIH